ncbi:protein kinase domain-containing protein [Metarhizium rileyi]|uniref:non-specific serine/threonine protein kinase n=1 Tax=Metarhizium rileyi (strain RCEF 4871) TaxID=1649241 RepID=A0A166VWM7_METRR|nr:protein kinase domain-containing protein [Metarhizium rileyi RCEF 4871]
MASSPEYKWIDGVECLEKYHAGGYHPLDIGDMLHERYEIVDKLGYGGWSIVWLAYDHQLGQFVAAKVGVAGSLPNESKVLRALGSPPSDVCPDAIPQILNEFTINGPNGSHPCYITHPALCNLRQSSFSRLFRIDVARALAYELTLAVAFVHSRGFVHGDIHLRNVLLRARPDFHNLSLKKFRELYGEPVSCPIQRVDGLPLSPGIPNRAIVPLDMSINARELTLSEAHLLLNDFGEAFAPAEERRLGKNCHTPIDFRPPEALFEPDKPLSFSADVWTLATAIWDILGMQSLFSSAFYSDTKVICQVVDTLGPLPAEWYQNWAEQGEFFDDEGLPLEKRYVWPRLSQAFEDRVLKFRREEEMGIFSQEESMAILDMMGQMLRLKPDNRATIEQILKSDWMVKWARVDYETAQRYKQHELRDSNHRDLPPNLKIPLL